MYIWWNCKRPASTYATYEVTWAFYYALNQCGWPTNILIFFIILRKSIISFVRRDQTMNKHRYYTAINMSFLPPGPTHLRLDSALRLYIPMEYILYIAILTMFPSSGTPRLFIFPKNIFTINFVMSGGSHTDRSNGNTLCTIRAQKFVIVLENAARENACYNTMAQMRNISGTVFRLQQNSEAHSHKHTYCTRNRVLWLLYSASGASVTFPLSLLATPFVRLLGISTQNTVCDQEFSRAALFRYRFGWWLGGDGGVLPLFLSLPVLCFSA